jgi:hypothetical protein
MLPFVKVAVHCPIQNTVQVIGLINLFDIMMPGGEAISVEKIYGKITYVSVHRNPLVTQSVPKVGTEVHIKIFSPSLSLSLSTSTNDAWKFFLELVLPTEGRRTDHVGKRTKKP